MPVSLATVSSTLHQFTTTGLINEIAIDGPRTYFDINPVAHPHFMIEETSALLDIPGGQVAVDRLPSAPEGYEIARIDVVVGLHRVGSKSAP